MRLTTRFVLIALLLVLLPLRGWAGSAVATGIAATAVVQAQIAHANSHAAMPADCEMLSQDLLDDAALHCSNCDTCGLCLAVANLTRAPWLAPQPTRHVSPLGFDASFSSAVRVLHLKPPIS